MLAEPQLVRIKGADAPGAGATAAERRRTKRTGASQSTLVGREWELTTLAAMLDRAIGGRGSCGWRGRPARHRQDPVEREKPLSSRKALGVEVFSTFCESHATDVPFHVVARLLRASVGSASWTTAARAQVHPIPDADPQDLLLLDDLLGIADPEVELPKIDPDARRRRLTALINTAQLAPHHTGGVRSRGCALDRRGQRIHARGLSCGDSPDPVAGADHLSPRISRRSGASRPALRPSPWHR